MTIENFLHVLAVVAKKRGYRPLGEEVAASTIIVCLAEPL